MRRGGRSSLGRGSDWPVARAALYWLWLALEVVGAALWGIWGRSVGMGVLLGAVLGSLCTWLYNERWQRLQQELFVKRDQADGDR